MRTLLVAATVTLGLAGCGPRDPGPPVPEALEILRANFLHDDVTAWLGAPEDKASMRSLLAERGFILDGSGRQGAQDVDGFVRGLGDDRTAPLAGLTAVYDSASGLPTSVTVVALAPVLRDQAQALVTFSRETQEASSSTSPATLYGLGAIRLTPERLLRVAVRLDKGRTERYSVMYQVDTD